jgi:hypothetical protein
MVVSEEESGAWRMMAPYLINFIKPKILGASLGH